MIYYLFSEKERVQLVDLLCNELMEVRALLDKAEIVGRGDMTKFRALKERRELLLCLFYKISNNKEKSLEL
ncbi:hypothetical protein [Metabacillus bambusae]|uniref:50S ribosomal protein L29 n=1 Tax=Metabacillus bambusae TaxID=2795218 RepID=A0ABS3NAI2_9BACI|nr:hypothetical protein [Metabacillus bambusae]MBO1515296.1 hypothetical protein [Metabacillus bambusae]